MASPQLPIESLSDFFVGKAQRVLRSRFDVRSSGSFEWRRLPLGLPGDAQGPRAC